MVKKGNRKENVIDCCNSLAEMFRPRLPATLSIRKPPASQIFTSPRLGLVIRSELHYGHLLVVIVGIQRGRNEILHEFIHGSFGASRPSVKRTIRQRGQGEIVIAEVSAADSAVAGDFVVVVIIDTIPAVVIRDGSRKRCCCCSHLRRAVVSIRDSIERPEGRIRETGRGGVAKLSFFIVHTFLSVRPVEARFPGCRVVRILRRLVLFTRAALRAGSILRTTARRVSCSGCG